jgi:hypothetical protein
MQCTVTLKKVRAALNSTSCRKGISELIPTEACYLGWQKSLTLLAKLIDRDPATGQPTAAGALGLSLVAVSGCCA